MMHPLRPFQKQALGILLDPSDQPFHLICVAATGSGKSRIFEEACLKANQRALLVTPLIALGRQQEMKLKAYGLNVFITLGGRRIAPKHQESGVWILSPESLQKELSRELKAWKPTCLIVDECHCLWEWGESFRPDFKKLPDAIPLLQIRRSLWLTATLPAQAREHLKAQLPETIIEQGGFDLPQSLKLRVWQVSQWDRVSAVRKILLYHPGPVILFVNTRSETKRVKQWIETLGRVAWIYHAGLSFEERQNLEHAISEQKNDVIVATSAFGMGMNFTHIEVSIVMQLPLTLLSLVQQLGRTGRSPDKTGFAYLLWDEADLRLLEWALPHHKLLGQWRLFKRFLTPNECRKLRLQEIFDGILTQEKCGRCDFCELNK